MQIWERIFEILRLKLMTQKEFSKKTGIPESTISDWKRKRINPSTDRIPVICRVLGVSPDYLLGISDTNDGDPLIGHITNLSFTDSKDISEFQIKKDLVKKIRMLARLSHIKLEDSEHNSNLFIYFDYLGIDKLEFVKKYLSQLQPFMIYEIDYQDKWDNAVCILDEYYKISIYIKKDEAQQEELIVSFHEDNENSMVKRNTPFKSEDMIYVFEDSVSSRVMCTDNYTIKFFIMSGAMSFPIVVPAVRYDEDGFEVKYSYINNTLIDICNGYLEDLYASDLDISRNGPFPSFQKLSFSSNGNEVVSIISMLIESILVLKNSIDKQIADAILCIYCNNTNLTDIRRTELLETLKLRFAVNSIKILPQILEQVENSLPCT